MNISEYRSHLRMAEILNKRVEYEDILYENKIYVNKNLKHLNRDSVAGILNYFHKSFHKAAPEIISLCSYYHELLQYEKLDIV